MEAKGGVNALRAKAHFYNEEWTGAAWETLRTYLAPMAMSAEVERAADISGLMRKVRGNRMAKAAIERRVGIWRRDI